MIHYFSSILEFLLKRPISVACIRINLLRSSGKFDYERLIFSRSDPQTVSRIVIFILFQISVHIFRASCFSNYDILYKMDCDLLSNSSAKIHFRTAIHVYMEFGMVWYETTVTRYYWFEIAHKFDFRREKGFK